MRGYGLTTTRSYSPNELIIEYCGDVISHTEMKRRSEANNTNNTSNKNNFYILKLGTDCLIDSRLRSTAARFVNHSCSPNAEIQRWHVNGIPHFGLFAMESISTGIELTCNYGDWFYDTKLQSCYCGMPNCCEHFGQQTQTLDVSSSYNGTAAYNLESSKYQPSTTKNQLRTTSEDETCENLHPNTTNKSTEFSRISEDVSLEIEDANEQESAEIIISRPIRRSRVVLDDEDIEEASYEIKIDQIKTQAVNNDSKDEVKSDPENTISKLPKNNSPNHVSTPEISSTPKPRGRPKGFKPSKSKSLQSFVATPSRVKSKRSAEKRKSVSGDASEIYSGTKTHGNRKLTFPIVLKLPRRAISFVQTPDPSIVLPTSKTEAMSSSSTIQENSSHLTLLDQEDISRTESDENTGFIGNNAEKVQIPIERDQEDKSKSSKSPLMTPSSKRKLKPKSSKKSIGSKIGAGKLNNIERNTADSIQTTILSTSTHASVSEPSLTSSTSSKPSEHTEGFYEFPVMVPEPRLVKLDSFSVAASVTQQIEQNRKKHPMKRSSSNENNALSNSHSYSVFSAKYDSHKNSSPEGTSEAHVEPGPLEPNNHFPDVNKTFTYSKPLDGTPVSPEVQHDTGMPYPVSSPRYLSIENIVSSNISAPPPILPRNPFSSASVTGPPVKIVNTLPLEPLPSISTAMLQDNQHASPSTPIQFRHNSGSSQPHLQRSGTYDPVKDTLAVLSPSCPPSKGLLINQSAPSSSFATPLPSISSREHLPSLNASYPALTYTHLPNFHHQNLPLVNPPRRSSFAPDFLRQASEPGVYPPKFDTPHRQTSPTPNYHNSFHSGSISQEALSNDTQYLPHVVNNSASTINSGYHHLVQHDSNTDDSRRSQVSIQNLLSSPSPDPSQYSKEVDDSQLSSADRYSNYSAHQLSATTSNSLPDSSSILSNKPNHFHLNAESKLSQILHPPTHLTSTPHPSTPIHNESDTISSIEPRGPHSSGTPNSSKGSKAKPRRGRPPNSTRLSLVSPQPIAPVASAPSVNGLLISMPASNSRSSEPFITVEPSSAIATPPQLGKTRRGRPPNSTAAQRTFLAPIASRPSPLSPSLPHPTEMFNSESVQDPSAVTSSKGSLKRRRSESEHLPSINAKQPRTLPPMSSNDTLPNTLNARAGSISFVLETPTSNDRHDSVSKQGVEKCDQYSNPLPQMPPQLRSSSPSPMLINGKPAVELDCSPSAMSSIDSSCDSSYNSIPATEGELTGEDFQSQQKRGRGRPRTRPEGYWTYNNRKARGEFGPGPSYGNTRSLTPGTIGGQIHID